MALCLVGFATHAEEVTYTVKAGDTLSKIALTYRTSVDTLVETNTIANRDLIHPKQRLRISASERVVVASSQKVAATSRSFEAVPPTEAVVVKAPVVKTPNNTQTVETTLYICTIRSSGSPHCVEKAMLGQHEQVISTSVTPPTNILSLDVPRDVSAETLTDRADIDTVSVLSFSVVQDLFPLSLSDTRTKRRASIRNFLRTYLGPPYDLAQMEDVLLDAPFPIP